MSTSAALATTAALPTVSRPKIHRPPKLPPLQPAAPVATPSRIPGFLFFWAAVFLMLVGVTTLVKHQTAMRSDNVSAAAPSEQPAAKPELPSVSSTVPAPVLSSPTTSKSAEKSGKTILLQDKSEIIVGQMAKIPTENEQISEIKTISDIDNHAGRELLSIISKY